MKKYVIIILLTSFSNLFADNLNDYFQNLNTDYKNGTFINSNTVFLIGTNGVINKSSNKGESWSILESPTNEDLHGIAYNEEGKTLFVTGNNGILLTSNDEGLNWEKTVINSERNLYSIGTYKNYASMTSDSGIFYTSSDYGITWKSNYISTEVLLKDVHYLNEGRAVMCDNNSGIYISDNNFEDYKRVNTIGELVISESGHIKSEGSIVAISCSKGFLISEDNAETWNFYGIKAKLTPGFNIIEQNKLIFTIYPEPSLDNQYCVFSSKIIDKGLIDNPFEYTIEGDERMFATIAFNYISNKFNNNKDAIVCGMKNSIILSNDYHKHWKNISYIELEGQNLQIKFMNDKKGFFLGPRSEVYYTNDSGSTWQIGNFNYKNIVYKTALDLVPDSESDIYTYFDNGVYYSKNGGRYYDSLFNPRLGKFAKFYDVNKYITFSTNGILPNVKTGLIFGDYSKDKRLNILLDSMYAQNSDFINENSFYIYGMKFDTMDVSYGKTNAVFHPFCNIYDDSLRLIKEFNIPKEIEKIYIVKHFEDSTILVNGVEPLDSIISRKSFKSTDMGTTFREVELGNYWFKDFIRFENSNYLAVSDSGYLFASYDNGDNWKLLANNDQNKYRMRQMVLVNGVVYIWGYECLYRSKQKLNKILSSVDDYQVNVGPPPFFVKEPYPNPTKNNIKVGLYISKAVDMEKLKVEIYDLFGKIQRNTENFEQSAISDYLMNYSINLNNLSDGVYYLKITYGDFIVTKPINLFK